MMRLSTLNIYLISVILLGLGSTLMVFDYTELHSISLIIMFITMGILFALTEVELFYERFYSGTTIITFTTFFVTDLNHTLIVIMIISLFETIYYKYEVKKGLFNYSQDALGIICSCSILNFMGININQSMGITNLFNLVLMILLYYLFNLFFISIVFKLIQSKSYVDLVKELVREIAFSVSATTLLSLYLIFSYEKNQNYSFMVHIVFLYTIFLIVRYVFKHYIDLRKSYISMIEALAQMADQKTNQDQHAVRVGWIAKQIGEELRLPPDQLDLLYYGAMFHDIGKTSLDSKIFDKRGPLTLDEQKEYETHVQLGYEWLSRIEGCQPIAEIVLHHHESWDGKGFPKGLSGKAIPVFSRIIAVANELDHLLTIDKSSALHQLRKLAGVQLDPELVDIALGLTSITEQYNDPQEIGEWKEISNYVSEIRQKIYSSELLSRFGVNQIVNYTGGKFLDQSHSEATVPCSFDVKALAEQAIAEERSIRQNLQDYETGNIYDVYCIPAERSANILIFNVTQVISYEKEQEMKMRKIYKDVIYAVTQAKLLLIEKEEIGGYLKGDCVAQQDIIVPEHISQCRHAIDRFISPMITDSKKKYKILLCINECLTNVLKHATHGKMEVYYEGEILRILVQDNGAGIDLADLPKSTLMQGYSTKLSLGQGFKLMTNYSDRLILSTTSSGTSILLEFKIESDIGSVPNSLLHEEGMKLA
jgi:putative nucleotidyltransferase with HDIG domain